MAVGFREDFSYLNTGLGEDPFKDLFPKEPFEYTQFNIPKEEAPPVIIPDTSGGEDRDTRTYYNTPTGRVYSDGEGTYTYDDKQAFAPGSFPSELAWGLSNYGKPVDENDVPIPEEDLAWYEKLGYNLMPGKTVANFIGDQMLSNQIDAIDTQFDRLTAPDLQPNNYNFNKGNQPQGIPASNLTVVTDVAGNVYYTEKGSKKEQELEEEEKRNSLNYDIQKATGFDLDLEDLTPEQLAAIESFSGVVSNITPGSVSQSLENQRAVQNYISQLQAQNAAAARSAAQAQAAQALAQANRISTAEAGARMNQARQDLASERGAGYNSSSGDGDYGGGTGGQTAGDEAGGSSMSSPFSKGGYVGPLGNRR